MQDQFPPAPASMGSLGPPATFGQRLIARLIDIGLVIAMLIPVMIVLAILGRISGILGFLAGMVLYLLVTLAAAYMILGGVALTGQSPGQRMQGVKVMSDSGELLGWGGAIIRWFVSSLSNTLACLLPIGSLWMLWDAEKKTLYDKILNNQAISVEPGSITPIFPGGKPI